MFDSIDFTNKVMLPALRQWREQKEKEGFIPTVELLISELEEKYHE